LIIFVTIKDNIMEKDNTQKWNEFYLRDSSFVNLMTRRIFNV